MGFLQFLFEGKVEDFKKIFKDKYTTPEQMDAIVRVSSEVEPKHKYLIWLAKSLTKPTTDEAAFAEELANAQELLMRFNTIGSNLPIKDISQYKSISELAEAIKTYENRQRRTIKKVDGADIIYDDDDYTIVHPKEYKASCFYGKGSKWCTASEDSDSNWRRYNEDAKLFYFLSKKLPTSDRFYKVAILQNYNGERTFWDAPDKPFTSGWIIGTDYLNDLLKIVDQYMKDNYSREVEIFSDKQKAQAERERLRRIEAQERLNRKRQEAESRRENNEWDPEEITHGEVGAKAWALFTFLTQYDDLEAKQPGDTERIETIESELERLGELQSQYEAEGRDLTEINEQISELEEEKEGLEKRIDVYDMIPEHNNYGMTVFSIASIDRQGYEYTVGDEEQVEQAAYEYEKDLIRDTGYDSFNPNYIKKFINADAVADEARENYNYWLYDEPSSYLDDNQRSLSKEQEKEIAEYQEKIDKYKRFLKKAEDRQVEFDSDSSQYKAIQKGLDKLNDLITDLEYDIENIKDDPQGDFSEDLIEEKIDELVDDVRNNPLDWLEEMGSNIADYIDEDEIIKDIISDNGYYNILNGYSGEGDEITWDGETYHIMNTDR